MNGAPTVASLMAVLGADLTPAEGFAVPDREISAVHLSELADPTAWLSGGELLLTTGLTLEATDCEEYVARLVAAGLAAIGLGLGPIYDEVPDQLVRACRRFELPLLVVPPPTPFITISRAYWSAVARSGEDALTDQLAAQRALVDASASRDPGLAVLRTLAEWLSGWAATFAATGEVLHVHPAARARQAEALGEELRRAGVAQARTVVALTSGRHHVVAVPLLASGQRVGHLAVATGRRLDPGTRRTVLTAAALLGLAGSRSVIAETRTATRLEDLAWLLDEGRVDVARRLARATGTATPGDLVRVLAVRTSAMAAVDDAVSRWAPPFARLRVGTRQVWFVLPPQGTGVAELRERLLALDPTVAATLSPAVPVEGVATEQLRRIARLDDLADGFVEVEPRPASDVGDRLARLDTPALRATLEAYLRHHGQWEAAARALGVHRNTLRHRVARAGELLELDLDDPDVRAVLWLTLRGVDGLDTTTA